MGYLLVITSKFFGSLIISAGSHLNVTISGIYFLAVPVTSGSGAYVMVILQKMGMPLSLAVILSLGFAGLLAIFFAIAYVKMSNDSYAVLTLASIVAMDALVKSWDSVTGGVMGIAGIGRPEVLSKLPYLVMAQGLIALLVIIFEYAILKTAFGRHLRALKENHEALSTLGVSPKQTGAVVVILSAMLAAIAGIFAIWRIRYLDPSFSGIPLLLETLTIAILAYRPKVFHLVMAAVFVTLLPEVLRFLQFSSVILGHMRMLLYSLFIMMMIGVLSKRHIVTDRSY